MNTITSKNPSRRSSRPKRLAVLAVALGGCLASFSSSAAVFHDAIHTLQNIVSQAIARGQDAAQYGKDVSHYLKEIEHYRQQLTTMMNFMDNSMLMQDKFEERADDYGMKASCPGTPDIFNPSTLWKQPSLDLEGDINAQQLEICQKIVLAQNARYNEQVRMLKRIRENDLELKRLALARAAVGSSQGGLASNSNDIQRFSARASMDLQYSQTVMLSYDGYVASLQQDQQRLAIQALNGKNRVFGTVAQGVTLKAALRALKERDR